MLRKVVNFRTVATALKPLATIRSTDKLSSINFHRSQSDAASNETSNVLSSFKCAVNNPLEHDIHHTGKFYTLENSDVNEIDPFQECLGKEFYAESKAFLETNLMIRKPAVEIINYLKEIDLTKPAYRFILYGENNGTGKRSTLFHIMHYCQKDNWLIINIPNCSSILRITKEIGASFYKEGRVDTPLEANNFLKRFRINNQHRLSSLDIRTTKEYKWSMRDSSPIGTPLLELIDLANERVKYSSDICAAIMREIKLQSSSKNFKVLVSIDGVNSYFGPTRIKREDKSEVQVDEITVVRSFKKLLKNDWTNAVIVGSVGKLGTVIPGPNKRKKYYDSTIPVPLRRRVECTLHYEGPLTPIHLLKKEGFYYLEPFVPVNVPSYSDREILNYHEYYKYNDWLLNEDAKTDDGREELIFLSGKNPAEFTRVCQGI